MSTTSTPVWSSAQNAVLGQAGAATAGSAQINQLLGTHSQGLMYQSSTYATQFGASTTHPWLLQSSTLDIDQPFPLTNGTAISRVQFPVLPVGNGADLLVSLCQNSGGNPGTVIVQTRIPASWIAQLSSLVGASTPSSAIPPLAYTGNPLAVAQFNQLWSGVASSGTWLVPAPDTTGGGLQVNSAYIDLGNGTAYLVQAGGFTGSSSSVAADVYTVALNSTGVVGPSVPQQSLLQPNSLGALMVVLEADGSTYSVVLAGGSDVTAGTPLSGVFTASLDPSSGNLGAWTTQTSLPSTTAQPGVAAYNGYIYIVGGYSPTSSTQTSAVYYGQVQNGQITAWNTGAPLPNPTSAPWVAALDGFLIVYGGSVGGTIVGTAYYAQINSNGSLGPWISSPNTITASESTTSAPTFSSWGMMPLGINVTLTATPFGPSPWWQVTDVNYAAVVYPASCASGVGSWQFYALQSNGTFQTNPINLLPTISVPLPAVGLTNGATYHLLLQQQGGDLNNYLRFPVGFLSGGPTAQTSAKNAYSWSANPIANGSLLTQIYVNPAVRPVGQMPLHTWEDNGARITTVIQATTPDQRVLGICEATQTQLGTNQNQGFENGITPWTVNGGTVTQSSVQVREGRFAARVVPTGSATQTYLESEKMPCLPGQSVTVSSWMWATAAVTSNIGVYINWYTTAGAFVSTSTNPQSIGAATYTQFTTTVTNPTTTGYQFTIVAIIQGTPAASQVFYVDSAVGYWTYAGKQQSTVTQFLYPSGATYPVIGAVELA